MQTKELKDKLRAKKQPKPEHVGKLSSSLTVLNLLCSGKATWAFRAGQYFLV